MKSFTQQGGLPQQAIDSAIEILKTGRLHRYNTLEGEVSEAALLEAEYAQFQEAAYCIACSSGGMAMQIALRVAGVGQGDKILANAYTLAPVPGAMHAVGAVPVFVEINDHWHIDLEDLRLKAEESQAKVLLLSHMRGHLADMDGIMEICREFNITLIEDCAHTMGAKWKGIRSGNFGNIACFSNQTYKHMNSGEGGFITTNDEECAARAIITSGSYMLYERHGNVPAKEVFDRIKLDCPNLSGRMDNLRATLLRHQLPMLDENTSRWNERYEALRVGLSKSSHLFLPLREAHEEYVGSSIQFQTPKLNDGQIKQLVKACKARGVELKWFGAEQPEGFTSRYDSWRYLGSTDELPNTKHVLSKTLDMRVPLTFEIADCELIADIIGDEVAAAAQS